MKWKNVTKQLVKIASEYVHPDAWEPDGKPRPAMVEVPPSGVIEIRDELSLRSRSIWARDLDLAAIEAGEVSAHVVPSPFSNATNGMMVPADAEAQAFYDSTFHDQLPQVIRHFEELRRRDERERGEAKVVARGVNAARPRILVVHDDAPAPVRDPRD